METEVLNQIEKGTKHTLKTGSFVVNSLEPVELEKMEEETNLQAGDEELVIINL